MMNGKKMLSLMAAIILVLCFATGACADRVYTSPNFHIPSDRITIIVTIDSSEEEPEISVQTDDLMTEEAFPDDEGASVDEPIAESETALENEPVAETEVVSSAESEIESAEEPEAETEPTVEVENKEEPADEPETETEPTVEVENEEEPVDEPETETELQTEWPELKVMIRSNLRPQMTEGETVRLTCTVEGLEGRTASYQWQVDKGNGWEDIPDATDSIMTFTASRDTLAYNWRVIVEAEAEE